MKPLLQRPWLLAALVFGVTLLPVLLFWQRHRAEARRNEAQIFAATANVVEEQVKLALVRHLNVFNQLRNQIRAQSAEHDALRLPPGFGRAYPHLKNFGYAARRGPGATLRWLQTADAALPTGTDLMAEPRWRELFSRAAQTGAPVAAADGGDVLVACAIGDAAAISGFVVGWLDVGALCRDPSIVLVKSEAIVARPLAADEVAPADHAVATVNEGGLGLRLALGRGPTFATTYAPPASWLLLAAGAGVSVLLAGLVAMGGRALRLRAALDTERERARLVQGFSHELRTPLSVILSSVELLSVYAERLSPERRREALTQIHDAAQRLSGMVNNALLLSRLESGRLEVQLAVHDVGAICRAVAAEIGAALRGRCPVRVTGEGSAQGDAALLRTVIANLLENAVKYSAPGCEVVLTLTQRGGELEITIEDSGIGVPAADQARLGEPYQRATNVGDVPGTGLGLTLVRRSLEPMRGRFSLSSTEGRGTKVTVVLPAS